MTTLARFEEDRLSVTPGEPAEWQLTVTNAGTLVEAYRFEPKGDLADYATVEPALLSLYPDTDGTVTVTVDVPRTGDVLAGDVAFAVLVAPQEQADQPAVPEGTVTVAPFVETTAELSPRTVPARRWTRHSLAVDNRGNQPIVVDLLGRDADNALRVRCVPDSLRIEPGQAAFSKVRTRASTTIWRGQPRTIPFQVLPVATGVRRDAFDVDVTAEQGQPQPEVPGQVLQRPVFPRGTGKALGLVAAAIAGLAVLWVALLRPVVRSEARDAAKEAVAQQLAGVQNTAGTAAQQAKAAGQQAGQASQQAKAAVQQAAIAGGQAKRAAEAAGTGSDSFARDMAEGIRPFGQRLVASPAPGDTAEKTLTVPPKMVLSVTDLVFQSQGDFGTVDLLRDGLPLITLQSQDYRTLDQHFVSPIILTAGQQLGNRFLCRTVAPSNTQCQSAVYVSGTLQPEVPPAPVATPPTAATVPGEPSSTPTPPPSTPDTSTTPPPTTREEPPG